MRTSKPFIKNRNKLGASKPIFVPNLVAGNSLKDIISQTEATVSISGARWGIVNGVVAQFAANQPRIEDEGFGACPAFTQYFLNNQAPVTQSITLVAGSYCLWIEGSGSATFNGLTATAGNPKVFTFGSGFTGNCTISGTVTKVMLNSGLFPAPFTPTAGTTVSVVSEAATATTGTSFDLDLSTLSRLKTGLRGPNAQGHIELEFESNVDSGWLPSGSSTFLNVFSVANNQLIGSLYFQKDSSGNLFCKLYDGTTFPFITLPTITVGQTFKISIDYGTYTDGSQKMRLTVNGVKSSVFAFSGSFGSQDLRFFYGNTVHAGWIKKDSLKYYERPIW